MLHLELVAGVSGAAHAHAYYLWVEGVSLDELAEHQLWKPGPVPSQLHFAWFHQSPSLVNLGDAYCNTIDIAYSYHRQ